MSAHGLPVGRKRLRIDAFMAGLILALAIGFTVPGLGRDGGVLHLEWITRFGVCGIFLLYGLTLDPKRMLHGFGKARVHIAVQLMTFVVFPLVVLALLALLPASAPQPVLTGLFYVAAVPSTVSSSVAMVSLARGNVPVAVFNATISSLIGVVVTPLWMSWYLSTDSASVPVLPMLAKVALLVVLPIVFGQLARIWLAGWASRNGGWIKHVDRIIILFIVLGAVSNTTAEGIWSRHEPTVLVVAIMLAVVTFFICYGIGIALARALKFETADRIAFLFCSSKKSLAFGVPLAPVVLPQTADIGLALIPLMAFHFFQLIIVSVIAGRYARRTVAVDA